MFRSVTTRISGLVILIAGLWGGLIPFVGPYFHFTLGPDHTWTWTSGRFYLSVLPAIAAILGGLFLLGSGPRLGGRIGALLALAGGIWFAVGPNVSTLWHSGGAQGATHGHKFTRMLELLTMHTGLGVLIATFAAYALPGFLAFRGAAAAAGAGAGAAATTREPIARRRFGLFGPRVVPADGDGAAARSERAPAGSHDGDGARDGGGAAQAPAREQGTLARH